MLQWQSLELCSPSRPCLRLLLHSLSLASYSFYLLGTNRSSETRQLTAGLWLHSLWPAHHHHLTSTQSLGLIRTVLIEGRPVESATRRRSNFTTMIIMYFGDAYVNLFMAWKQIPLKLYINPNIHSISFFTSALQYFLIISCFLIILGIWVQQYNNIIRNKKPKPSAYLLLALSGAGIWRGPVSPVWTWRGEGWGYENYHP